MSRLSEFLETIAPERTLDALDSRADHAFNTFAADVARVRHWKEFEDVLAGFYCHLENCLLALRRPRSPNRHMDFGRCHHVLLKLYGPNGEKTAYELALSGMEGGLPVVLRNIAQHTVELHATNEIGARVSAFMNQLTAMEMMDCAKDYASQYRDILPPEYSRGTPVRAMVDFAKILTEHPRALRRIRHTGR